MVLGVQPPVPENNPGQEKPWRAAKALAPYRWAHKLALPYPTSAQESVSLLLSGHTHALKDLPPSWSHIHTHACNTSPPNFSIFCPFSHPLTSLVLEGRVFLLQSKRIPLFPSDQRPWVTIPLSFSLYYRPPPAYWVFFL